MPDIGGWDFVEMLKADKEIDMDQIYIVLLSAYIQPKGTEQKCADRNVTCINKPLMDNNIAEIKQTFALAF
jgi:CheY-like chemotaxis protein